MIIGLNSVGRSLSKYLLAGETKDDADHDYGKELWGHFRISDTFLLKFHVFLPNHKKLFD